jgi:hypothetical protein
MNIKEAIENADKLQSKLTPEYISKLDGLSSPKVWHLLNNLVGQAETYLEIGVFKGSTLLAALYGNTPYAVALDDFSMAPETRAEFFTNTKGKKFTFIEGDAFSCKLTRIKKPIEVYFYDGHHTPECQMKALEYFIPAMADEFVYVCDDFDRKKVSIYTHEAIKHLNLEVVEFHHLTSQDKQWWEGIGVLKLRKK